MNSGNDKSNVQAPRTSKPNVQDSRTASPTVRNQTNSSTQRSFSEAFVRAKKQQNDINNTHVRDSRKYELNVQDSRSAVKSTTASAPIIKTQVNNNAPRQKTVTTDADVKKSYEKKAEQGAERSNFQVRNVGSVEAVTENISKRNNTRSTQVSERLPFMKSYDIASNKSSVLGTGVVKNHIVAKNRMLSELENRHSENRDTLKFLRNRGSVSAVEYIKYKHELKKEYKEARHNIAVSPLDIPTPILPQINNADYAPQTLINATGNDRNRKIQDNLTLSSAFCSSAVNSKNKNYSGDVKQAFKEVGSFTHGDPFLMNSYLKKANPQTSREKFNYTVVKRKMVSEIATDKVNTLMQVPTMKNIPKVIANDAISVYNERLLMYATRPRCMKEIVTGFLQNGLASAANTISGKMLASEDLGTATVGGMIIALQAGVTISKGAKKVMSLKNLPSRTIMDIQNKARAARETVNNIKNFGKQVKTNVIHGYKVVRNAVNTVRNYGLVSKVTLSKVGHGISKASVATLNVVAHRATRTVTKGVVDVINGRPFQIASSGALGVASLLGNSENEYVRGAGTAIKATDFTIKTGVSAVKTGTHVVKTAVVKSAKGTADVVQTVQSIQRHGLKKTFKMSWYKTKSDAFKRATKGIKSIFKVFDAIFESIKNKALVAIVPVLCVVLVFTVIIFGGGVTIVSAMFGGSFSITGIFSGGLFSPDAFKILMSVPAILTGGDVDVDTEITVDFDVEEFLSNEDYGVPHLRKEYIDNLVKYLNKNKTKCDIVRLRMDGVNQADVIDTTAEGIDSIFYTNKELIEIIQPVFQSKILLEYDLSPSDKQAKNTLQDIFDELFPNDFSTESMEYCGQDLLTGIGTPNRDSNYCTRCHEHHEAFADAKSDCPNPETKKHSTHRNYTDHPDSIECEKCDIKSCVAYDRVGDPWKVYDWNGNLVYTIDEAGHFEILLDKVNDSNTAHQWRLRYTVHGNGADVTGYITTYDIVVRSDGSYLVDPDTHYSPVGMSEMNYCDNWESKCTGYNVCKGHKVLTTKLHLAAYEELLDKEFIKEIHNLEDDIGDMKDTDTKGTDVDKYNDELDDKENKLQQLQENLEFCYEYMELLNDKYISVSQYEEEKKNFLPEDISNQAVVEFAIGEVGNVGGSKYIRNYYYDKEEDDIPKNLEWSGCFIVWCKEKNLRDGERLLCNRYATAREMQRKGASKPKMIPNEEISSGMNIIFLDFNGDGKAQRCGLVVGKTDEYVFVVEGNCSDRVCITKYKYDDSQILGYI